MMLNHCEELDRRGCRIPEEERDMRGVVAMREAMLQLSDSPKKMNRQEEDQAGEEVMMM